MKSFELSRILLDNQCKKYAFCKSIFRYVFLKNFFLIVVIFQFIEQILNYVFQWTENHYWNH